MKPIAQTFYINEPENGVPGVYVTCVDLFFQSKSPTYGVQVQIRQTDNGNPTPYVMPHADITVEAANVNISDDATAATTFRFPSPVFLQSATSYALVIIPVGGNPDYKIWTGEIGKTDVTTTLPITKNNDTGTLFISSNDIQFTSIPTEDIKFRLYTAVFKHDTGTAVFTPLDSDYIQLRNINGKFKKNELVVMSNNSIDLARLNYSSNTGAFTVGETVFQRDGTGSNVATGVIYSIGAGTAKITNTTGSWTNVYQMKGSSSNSNATLTAVYNTVSVTEGSNSIVVPFTDVFSINQLIYVVSNSGIYTQCFYISSVPDNVHLISDQISNFTDNVPAEIGRVRGDKALHGNILIENTYENPDNVNVILNNVTSTPSLNFSKSANRKLIGLSTGASAIIKAIGTNRYETIVPQFSQSTPGDTNISWTFRGVENNAAKTPDNDEIPLTNMIEKELTDKSRTVMSRSLEYALLPSERKGDYSIYVTANFSSGNNKISPVVDNAQKVVNFIGNAIVPRERLSGYRLIFDSNNPFFVGDVIFQQNNQFRLGTATVRYSFVDSVIIDNVNGFFSSAVSANITLTSDNSMNVALLDSTYFNEINNNNLKYASRYISKNVVLAEGQDAEDLHCFLTAYRPATTDFLVYARVQNKEDTDKFANKNWTLMDPITSPALLSSTANPNDFIELEYQLPKSLLLHANSCSGNTSSPNAYIVSTADVKNDTYIYFEDNVTKNFTVQRVRRVVNNSVVVLDNNLPFDTSNASVGIIPNLETTAGCFIYAQNNNVVRYVTKDNVVFDSYKTFAIKIVPIAETTNIIPRAKDMRAIALQV